ncbi:hypothetical protein QBC47DRAFT_363450 [Echria macrotheca]|uniref:Uncharacterized protein n=1 Tax=Echria macrotheca TaxID=438768 RepID=A0AAJ0F3W4_9PEZI|nr:hypothetical protein QBC47DRAFT_363450 [Echria macrotheca]
MSKKGSTSKSTGGGRGTSSHAPAAAQTPPQTSSDFESTHASNTTSRDWCHGLSDQMSSSQAYSFDDSRSGYGTQPQSSQYTTYPAATTPQYTTYPAATTPPEQSYGTARQSYDTEAYWDPHWVYKYGHMQEPLTAPPGTTWGTSATSYGTSTQGQGYNTTSTSYPASQALPPTTRPANWSPATQEQPYGTWSSSSTLQGSQEREPAQPQPSSSQGSGSNRRRRN